MEIVFAVGVFATLIYHGGKAVLEDIGDLKYAAKGKDHPRWAYRQAKLEAARRGEPTGYWQVLAARAWDKAFAKRAKAAASQKARPPKEPRPLRDYFGKCWADAWETEGIRHAKRVSDRRAKRAGTDGPVEAPVDTDLVPEPLAVPDTDGSGFESSVVHGADDAGAPLDQSSVPVMSPGGFDPELGRIQDLANQERALRLQYARERARAYLYGEGPFDRKPGEGDIEALGGGTSADRAMAEELRQPHPELDQRWDEAVRNQNARIIAEAGLAPAEPQAWNPYGPTPEQLERLALARRRARAFLYGEGLDRLDRKPDAEDAAVLLEGLTAEDKELANAVLEPAPDRDEAWNSERARRHHNHMVARGLIDQDGNPRSAGRAGQEEHDTEPGGSGVAAAIVPDNVIPININQADRPLPTPKGIEPMTASTTEIDGLESAIAWAAEVKSNAADMASGIDDVEGDFAARKVTGDTLALVGQIGETYEELRDKAAELEKKLQAMQSVGEAYDATPDAGDKEFVTS